MDWISGMQKAIDYIEENLTCELDYNEISKCAHVSNFHFQRVFSILCGCTVGEYIRNRRLTLAGQELSSSDIRVIDVALKYGYDTPESFTKAFARFHGITPRTAREPGAKIKSFCRLSIKILLEGGDVMDCKIEKKSELSFIGYKTKFDGKLDERAKQEESFWVSTREEQDILMGISKEQFVWYDINTNFSDVGYVHYIAVQSDAEPVNGFEKIIIPELTYAIFETDRVSFPTRVYMDLRKKIVSEWLPSSDFILAEGPEITVTHWLKKPDKDKRFIELWIPVNKKTE